MDKILTIGIPAYKAKEQICDVLASIQTQTFKDNVEVIIASDYPKEDYNFVIKRYPDLSIKILPCEKNTGPGLARQRALDACETPWITFIDADDVFMSPLSIERLIANTDMNTIIVQGPFFQEVTEPNPQGVRLLPRNEVTHPWVFGRAYNVKFLRDNNIRFSALRAMEDGEFNAKIRMLVEGTNFIIKIIDDPIYFWRTGSEHSITRIGIKENDGMPLYNFDLCQVGATAAFINSIIFCQKENPFNGNVTRFCVEQMVAHYFTYIECVERKPLFAKQCMFNAKRFYHSCYCKLENQISEKILKDLYTLQYAAHGQNLIGIIPQISFFDFMNKIKTEEYGGKAEFEAIRAELPAWVTELDKKSGVLGEEGYIYTIDEEKNE